MKKIRAWEWKRFAAILIAVIVLAGGFPTQALAAEAPAETSSLETLAADAQAADTAPQDEGESVALDELVPEAEPAAEEPQAEAPPDQIAEETPLDQIAEEMPLDDVIEAFGTPSAQGGISTLAIGDIPSGEEPVGKVYVSIEDSVPTPAGEDFPDPRGMMAEGWVDLYPSDSGMDAVVRFANEEEFAVEGTETNYIESIDGLEQMDRGGGSGWMITLNDWFINEGFLAFTVAKDNISAGDTIAVQYTLNYGEDVGGTWNNNNKTLKALDFSKKSNDTEYDYEKIPVGTLSPAFSAGVKNYTLTLPEGTEKLLVTPTAANKNFQVRASVGGTEYRRTSEIPVENGTVINITCGAPAWPTMNNGDGGAENVPAEAYTVKVQIEGGESEFSLTPDALSVTAINEDFSKGGEIALSYDEETKTFRGDLHPYTHQKEYNTVGLDAAIQDLPEGISARLTAGEKQYAFTGGIASTGEDKLLGAAGVYTYGISVGDEEYTLVLTKTEKPVTEPEDWQNPTQIGDYDVSKGENYLNDLSLGSYYVELKPGESYTLQARRLPEIVQGDTAGASTVRLPDFTYTLAAGDSVTLSETKANYGSVDGDAGIITAKKPGISIIEVAYGEANEYGKTYGAVSPVNTGVCVVYVSDGKGPEIKTSINRLRTGYDTIYTTGVTGSFSFTASVAGAGSLEVKADGETLTANNGKYTAETKLGSTLIEISATDETGTSKEYYIIKTKKVGFDITNVTSGKAAEDAIVAGDTARLEVSGLVMPVYKLATIYNPQFKPNGTVVEYMDSQGLPALGKNNEQYSISSNYMEFKVELPGEYTLTDGNIYQSWWGDPLGGDLEFKNRPANMDADTHSDHFGSLPDFTLTVGGTLSLDKTDLNALVAKYSAFTAGDYTAGTYGALTAALAKARVIADSDEVTQKGIDQAVSDLAEAAESLLAKADKGSETLAELIARCETVVDLTSKYHKYTVNSAAAFKSAIATAKDAIGTSGEADAFSAFAGAMEALKVSAYSFYVTPLEFPVDAYVDPDPPFTEKPELTVIGDGLKEYAANSSKLQLSSTVDGKPREPNPESVTGDGFKSSFFDKTYSQGLHTLNIEIKQAGKVVIGKDALPDVPFSAGTFTERLGWDAAALDAAFAKITEPLEVGERLPLTAKGLHGSVIFWDLGEGDLLSPDGKVTAAPAEDTPVSLAATLKVRSSLENDGGWTTKTATYNVVIKGEPEQEPAVTDVTLNESKLDLKVGASADLVATIDAEEGADTTVTWESSDTSVATVSANGRVTAVAAGSATITATADGKSAQCAVAVTETEYDPIVVTIPANQQNITVNVMSNMALNATVSGGAPNASKAVTWSILEQPHDTTNKDDQYGLGIGGWITMMNGNRLYIGNGEVLLDEDTRVLTVRATSVADQTKYADMKVTVIKPTLGPVTISPKVRTLGQGAVYTFSTEAAASPNNQAVRAVQWVVEGANSPNTTIRQSGFFNGMLTIGADETAKTLTIKAESRCPYVAKQSDTATVNVIPAKIDGVSINPEYKNMIVDVGSNTVFKATVDAGEGQSQEVIWSVDDNQSANTGIVASGSLTIGVDEVPLDQEGPSILTVRATSTVDPTKFDTATVTVLKPVINSVAINSVKELTLAQSSVLNLTASLQGEHLPKMLTTEWSIEGNAEGEDLTDGHAAGTTVKKTDYTDGRHLATLTIAADEPATELTLTMKSAFAYASPKEDSIKINVVPVTIRGISIDGADKPGGLAANAGASKRFPVIVDADEGQNKTFTWKVEGQRAGGGTSIYGSATANSPYVDLFVGANEIPLEDDGPRTLTVTVTSVADPSQSDTVTVTVNKPVIDSVTLRPAETAVGRGGTFTFTPEIATQNCSGSPFTTLLWVVKGDAEGTGLTDGHAAGTRISNTGQLQVAADETATALTITASTTYANAAIRTGNATVNVVDASINSVSVVPLPESAKAVYKGETQLFAPIVERTGGPDTSVIWSVTGDAAGLEGGKHAETVINEGGWLSVSSGETATELTVTATSAADGTKNDSVTLSVASAGSNIITPPVVLRIPTAAGMNGNNTILSDLPAEERETVLDDIYIKITDYEGSPVSYTRRPLSEADNALGSMAQVREIVYLDSIDRSGKGGSAFTPIEMGEYTVRIYRDDSEEELVSVDSFKVVKHDPLTVSGNVINVGMATIYPTYPSGYTAETLPVTTVVKNKNEEEQQPFLTVGAKKGYLLLRSWSTGVNQQEPYSWRMSTGNPDINILEGSGLRWSSSYAVQTGRFLLNQSTTFKITKGAVLYIFNKVSHYSRFAEYPLTKDMGASAIDEKYDVYTGKAPLNVSLHYEATISGAFKQAGMFTLTAAGTTQTIDMAESYTPIGGEGPAAYDGVYTNLDDTGSVELAPGETFNLDTFRVWQAMEGVIGNYFIEPEYEFVMYGGSAERTQIGAPGRIQQRLTAVENGVSVLKITYNPVILHRPASSNLSYDAIDPRLTGIAVINVGGNTKNFETGIDSRNDFDVYYFDRDAANYAEYSFKPASGSTVRVHDPLHDTVWGSGWSPYEPDGGGNFTVRLKEGRNIIEVKNGGSVKYHVALALGLNIDVINNTRPDETLKVGDEVEIRIDGMESPIQKMGGIYNPGFESVSVDGSWGGIAPITHVEYSNKAGEVVESGRSQYNLSISSPVSRITYTITEGNGVLTGGRISQGSAGSGLGGHRNIPGGGVAPNMGADTDTAGDGYFGALPDIALIGAAVIPDDGFEPPDPDKPHTNTDTPKAPAAGQVALLVKDPYGDTMHNGVADVKAGMTAYSVLKDALGEKVKSSSHPTIPGQYVYEIDGLAEFDEGEGSGWMYRVNGKFPGHSASLHTLEAGDVVEWLYTRALGGDLGGGAALEDSKAALKEAIDTAESLDETLFTSQSWAAVAEALAAAKTVYADEDAAQTEIDAAAKALEDALDALAEDDPGEEIAYGEALMDALGYIARTVPEPVFASVGGEWAVLAQARGGLDKEAYYNDYYARIIAYVQSVGSEKLHVTKSTDNARAILALTAIGKDAADVGGYDLTEPFSDLTWVKKQGINGPIWALIALDTKPYAPGGTALREALIGEILNRQIQNGGWNMLSSSSVTSPDITAMAIQSLAPYYTNNANVKAAVDTALAKLSELQRANGGYGTSESDAQVIVALSALGIDAMTDSRFEKAGGNPVTSLLAYRTDDGGFEHLMSEGVNPMATEQAAYALVAYDRFVKEENSLYDMSDVQTDEPGEDQSAEREAVMKAIDALPGTLGIKDKNAVILLADRLSKLDDFEEKASYTEKLNKASAAIQAIEERVEQLDADIWDKIDPKNITLADKVAVAAMMAAYNSLAAADRAYVENAGSLLDADAVIKKLEKKIIPRQVFANIKGSDAKYEYAGTDGNKGYTISFNGKDVGTPADMQAAVTIGTAKSTDAMKRLSGAYWFNLAHEGGLPASVTLSLKVGAADGEYTLYRYEPNGDLAQKYGTVQVEAGSVSFTTAKGGDYFLLKPAAAGSGTETGAANGAASGTANRPQAGTGRSQTTSARTAGTTTTAGTETLTYIADNPIATSVFTNVKGKTQNILIEGTTVSGRAYRLTFNGEDITNAMTFNPTVATGGKNAADIGLLAEDAFVMNLTHSGALPGKMLVEMETDLVDGEYLLFYYNELTRKAELVQKVSVTDGWTSFFLTHGSTYFIAKRALKASVAEIESGEASDAAAMDVVDVLDEPIPLQDLVDEQPAQIPWPLIIVLIAVGAAIGGFLLNRYLRKRESEEARP